MPQNFEFGDIPLETSSIEATYEGLTLTATVDPTIRDELENEYADQAGKIKKLVFEDGGFKTYDKSGTGISETVTPSDKYNTVYSSATYRISGYDDNPTSQGNNAFNVGLDLIREEDRTTTSQVTQTATGDKWRFDLYNDVISTELVEVTGTTGRGEVELVITTRDKEVARSFLENPTKQDAITEYTIPDGDNTIVDTSPGYRNTVDIVPSDKPTVREQVPEGEYVITDWTVGLSEPNLWNISLAVANNTLVVRDGYTVTGEETFCSVAVESGATLTVPNGATLFTGHVDNDGTVDNDGNIVNRDKYDTCENKTLSLVSDYTVFETETYCTVSVASGATLTVPSGTTLNCAQLNVDGTINVNGTVNVSEKYDVC